MKKRILTGRFPLGIIKSSCGFSSSGRAPPCQGGGSEFEPRNPLQGSSFIEEPFSVRKRQREDAMKNDQSVACEEKTGLHLCRFDQYSKKISKIRMQKHSYFCSIHGQVPI